jgi:hypothetical protein
MIPQLEELRNKLLKSSSIDEEEVRVYIQIMREVGGYEQFMNMPIPAVKEMYDFLKWENKQIKKSMPKAKKH